MKSQRDGIGWNWKELQCPYYTAIWAQKPFVIYWALSFSTSGQGHCNETALLWNHRATPVLHSGPWRMERKSSSDDSGAIQIHCIAFNYQNVGIILSSWSFKKFYINASEDQDQELNYSIYIKTSYKSEYICACPYQLQYYIVVL